jgi:hypothetical protein
MNGKRFLPSFPLLSVLFCILLNDPCCALDSLNVRLVGNWPFGPAYDILADPVRPLVFLGSGGGVYVLNFGGPWKAYDTIRTVGIVQDLAYDSGSLTLYVAAGEGGLDLWDTTDPSAPLKSARMDMGSSVDAVAVAHPYTYVARADSIIEVIDVSDPRNPYVIGNLKIPCYATAIYLSSPYLYAIGAGLCVIDVSLPDDPILVGQGSTSGCGIFVCPPYAYVVGGGTFRVVDVSAPASPKEVGSTPEIGSLTGGIHVEYDIAYVTYYEDSPWGSWSGVSAVSVQSPTSPYEVVAYERPWFWLPVDLDMKASDTYVACGESGLWILDGTDWQVTPPGTEGVFPCGAYAYTVGAWGIRILDMSIPAEPRQIGFYEMNRSPHDIVVRDSIAYVADGWDGLVVLDVSDRLKPRKLGQWDTPKSINRLCIRGPYAYVADYGAGFRVMDVSDPANPYPVGFCEGATEDVCYSKPYVYGADGWRGLSVIDVTDPSNPQRVAVYDTPNYTRGVYAHGDYAYLADSDGGLRIVDVSATPPQEVGHIKTPDRALDVLVYGNYAYVAAAESGLRVIDISNPRNPVEVGYYDTPGSASNIHIADSHIFVANSDVGFSILEFLPTGIEEPRHESRGSSLELLSNPLVGSSIKLRVDVPSLQSPVIEIYNSSGQNVESFAVGELPPGVHDVNIPIGGLASGVYFLRARNMLSAPTLKVVVLR